MAARPTSSERRNRKRGPLNAEIVLKDERHGGQISFDSTNLSPGGVFLKSDLLLEVGETFLIEFTLPPIDPGDAGDAGDHERAIVADARVGWVRRVAGEDGAPAGMGIVFVDIAPPDADAIDRYLMHTTPAGRATS